MRIQAIYTPTLFKEVDEGEVFINRKEAMESIDNCSYYMKVYFNSETEFRAINLETGYGQRFDNEDEVLIVNCIMQIIRN